MLGAIGAGYCGSASDNCNGLNVGGDVNTFDEETHATLGILSKEFGFA
jgi:hypothetical protein